MCCGMSYASVYRPCPAIVVVACGHCQFLPAAVLHDERDRDIHSCVSSFSHCLAHTYGFGFSVVLADGSWVVSIEDFPHTNDITLGYSLEHKSYYLFGGFVCKCAVLRRQTSRNVGVKNKSGPHSVNERGPGVYDIRDSPGVETTIGRPAPRPVC